MEYCKSIQSSPSCSTARKYDVFVSFRGEDIRTSFADHLFAAFKRKGVVAFSDATNLKQGEHISSELEQAIEGSQVLIVVFSKNYATSTWCLQELAKIVDCIKVPTGQTVLPVFFDVSPSEVRKQIGEYYGKAFAIHEQRFQQDLSMVQRWREALTEVANLSGWDIQNKPQYTEIEKIVEQVINILGYKLSSLDGLVGMHSRVEQLEKLLNLDSDDDVRAVGICGMGGIGKTTLARAVYERNFHRYDATCYVDDVSKVYHDCGPLGAQKQLLHQILNKEIQDVWNLSKATNMIKTRLSRVKTFIVLDNVDSVEQVGKLGVNCECLCPGSRIVIISRDRQILNIYGVDKVYDAQLLNKDEARQLFCRKAFKRDYIMSSDYISWKYKSLTHLALEYVQCLPLAIEVLGSFLHGKNISEWTSALARLRDNPKKEIMDVLQMSFDGLEPTEKEIFLDIACFFPLSSIEHVAKVLDCCAFHPDVGIRVLIDKSLITATRSTIKMHDMLQELGKKIVRQKAPNEPGKWSRLWLAKDFQSVMYEKMAMDNVEAIRFTDFQSTRITFRAEALSRMNRLRLLIVGDVNFSGSFNYLSNNLQYLQWESYPFTYFPSSCVLTKLVQLLLPRSSIRKLWEDIKPLYNLKIMDLNGSKNLVKIPNLSGAPNLEQLDLKECTKLMYIHPSIGSLRKLVYLNLKNCTSLASLPKSILAESSLEVVNLQGCSKLFESKLLENARHGISDTSIQCRSTSSIFKRLKLMLPFHFFNSRRDNGIVGSLMSSLSRYQCLLELDLSYCNLLYMPKAMESLYCLERLNLRGNNFVTLPCVINELPRLIYLDLQHCKQLTSLYEFPLHPKLPLREGAVVWEDGTIVWEKDVGLNLFNCPIFVEMDGWPFIALSWMIQFLKFHEESSLPITIVIPGTQIPSWFNNQNMGGSITIDPFVNVRDSNWIGLAFCVAFIARDDDDDDAHNDDDDAPSSNNIECLFGRDSSSFVRTIAVFGQTDGVTIGSVHLGLLYLSRPQVISYIPDFNSKDGIELTLKSWSVWQSERLEEWHCRNFKVKHCGMRVVFKQDLEEDLNCDK